MKIFITRRFSFCAGHRLHKHKFKCRHFHGHNYNVEFTLTRLKGGLNSDDMVIDFGEIKDRFGSWIDQNWDHVMILSGNDKALKDITTLLPETKIYAMLGSPTAENMARHLLSEIGPSLLRDCAGVKLVKVAVWETDNCVAIAEANE